MLYKFKSRATADLIMLEPHGRRILQIIGKPVDATQGILLPAEMPAAIAALEAAIAQEEAATRRDAEAQTAECGAEAEAPQGVTLRQRAAPFIEMLRRCLKAEKEIVWGV